MGNKVIIRNVSCRLPSGDHSSNPFLNAIINNNLTQVWAELVGDEYPIQKWRLEAALAGDIALARADKSQGNNKWTPFCEDISRGVLDTELIRMDNGRSVRIFSDFTDGTAVGGRAKGPSKGSISKVSQERVALEKLKGVLSPEAYESASKALDEKEASNMSKDAELIRLRAEVEALRAAARK